jgi:hypothetical protein
MDYNENKEMHKKKRKEKEIIKLLVSFENSKH